MRNKKILSIIAAVAVISAGIAIFFSHYESSEPPVKDEDKLVRHVIDDSYKAALKDSPLDYKQENFSDEKVKEYFSDDVIDPHTYNFLQHLDDLFSGTQEGESSLEKIRQYLVAHLPPEQADKMYQLYSLYLDYQTSLQERLKEQGMPTTPEEALENLADLQDYRRAVFGDESADMIFGAGVEAQEYSIRRNAIIHDDDFYASEKEERLRELDNEMWGDELTADDGSNAYARYQEKLQLYKKDLSDLRTEEERQDFLRQLSLESFDPVQRERIEQAEGAIANEKQITAQYFAQKQEILKNPDLSEEERARQIRELQDETFGDQADAFRRREAKQAPLDMLKTP